MAGKKAKNNEEVSVEQKLIALYTLQQIDSQVDKIKIVRGELPLEVEDLEDAWDLIDEAHQCFGQGIILTDEEFKDIVNQNHINEVKTIKVDDKFTTNECGTITNWWVVEQNDLGIVLDNDSPRFSKFKLGLKEFMKKVKVGDFVPVEK